TVLSLVVDACESSSQQRFPGDRIRLTELLAQRQQGPEGNAQVLEGEVHRRVVAKESRVCRQCDQRVQVPDGRIRHGHGRDLGYRQRDDLLRTVQAVEEDGVRGTERLEPGQTLEQRLNGAHGEEWLALDKELHGLTA